MTTEERDSYMTVRAVIHVHDYDLASDTFAVTLALEGDENAPPLYAEFSGEYLAKTIGEHGEPDEFLKQAFYIEFSEYVKLAQFYAKHVSH